MRLSQPKFCERVAPMDAKDIVETRARRISAYAEGEWVREIFGETGGAANISRHHALRRLDFNEHFRRSRAFDDQIDFRASCRPQVGKAPVWELVA